MRHKLLVLTVKKFLQLVYIYGSYRKIKTGVPFFLDHPVHLLLLMLLHYTVAEINRIHTHFLLWWHS